MSGIPLISVVMPLYNKELEVSRAIKSVLSQTVQDFELIVVNDGSTDRGLDVASAIDDPRIRMINQENGGVSAARNRGIKETRSELIAFLDADDEWMPYFLETIFRLQRNYPSCSVFATNYLYGHIDGSFTPPIIHGLQGFPWEGIFINYFKVASRSDPPVWSSAVAVTKKAITSIGGFPLGVTFGEDLLTWAKLALDYGIAYSTQPCAICWPPTDVHDRPGRFENLTDTVGEELGKLVKNAEGTEIESLKEYAAIWHRMRASILLNLGKREMAFKELREAIRLSKMNMKLLLYLLIALMPHEVSMISMRVLANINQLRRRFYHSRQGRVIHGYLKI
jgi:glycosyltransferase involved in cell wall biosynthesis